MSANTEVSKVMGTDNPEESRKVSEKLPNSGKKSGKTGESREITGKTGKSTKTTDPLLSDRIVELEKMVELLKSNLLSVPIPKRERPVKADSMTIDELPYERGYVAWESTVTTMAIAASNRATEFHAYVEKAKECTKFIGMKEAFLESLVNVQKAQPASLADADAKLYAAIRKLTDADSRHVGGMVNADIDDHAFSMYGVCALKLVEYHFRSDLPTRQAYAVVAACELQATQADLVLLPEYISQHKETLRELEGAGLDDGKEPFARTLMRVLLYQRLKACSTPTTEGILASFDARPPEDKNLAKLYAAVEVKIDEISKERLSSNSNSPVAAPFVEKPKRKREDRKAQGDNARNAPVKRKKKGEIGRAHV